MKALPRWFALGLGAAVAGCQMMGGGAPSGPAPRACTLAAFEGASGLALQPSRKGDKAPRPANKSEPLKEAQSLPVSRDVGEPWADAGGGWKSWRFWLRSEEAHSMSVRLDPFSLPPGGELWLCAPDGTARLGPYIAKGPGSMGQLWSSPIPGNEIWLEVLVPADQIHTVQVHIAEAFAGTR